MALDDLVVIADAMTTSLARGTAAQDVKSSHSLALMYLELVKASIQ